MAVRYFPLLSLSYFSLLLRNFRFCCGKFGSQSWLGSYRIALKFNFEVFRINESVGDKYSVTVCFVCPAGFQRTCVHNTNFHFITHHDLLDSSLRSMIFYWIKFSSRPFVFSGIRGFLIAK
ncbi:hypothetical protein BCIN_14g01420 [Botrytis cinerea B05.10]|uniref:Secreted protein n=1 Tax=Botryotinia fuckeliana (strain B05.10) TaxID=332648 RepID=A0A384K286_BOTFB|nr:hypothetical protein BCIN_14g01420 [Botrytis cinerea B05.10]ATZ56935.1 hypothetical protein BCIN_14g01420 [Botrytis cinerea B05.10]